MPPKRCICIFKGGIKKRSIAVIFKVMTVHSRRQSKSRMSAANASVPGLCFPLGKLHFTKIPVWRISKILHLCLLDQIIIREYDFTSGQIKYAYISHLPSGEEPVFWEKTAFTLLFLLMSLFTDRLDWIFLCIFWETGAESLRFSADTCLAPWWIPFPLLRLGWPFFILLISSSLSCAAVWSWGKRWGWAKWKKQAKFIQLKKWIFENNQNRLSNRLSWILPMILKVKRQKKNKRKTWINMNIEKA